MDPNTLSSHCDRSIIGEQLSKMNSISAVSQYKCQKLRRTSASSSPIPSSEVSERAGIKEKEWVKEILIDNNHPGKNPPVMCQICHAVRLQAFKHICSHSCSLSLSSCRKEISMQLQITSNTSVACADFSNYTKTS